MRLITLQTPTLKVDIYPEAGASVVGFEGHVTGAWIPLMRPTPPEAILTRNSSDMASFTMAPWSNRIQAATFVFNGQTYGLQANTPQGYATHGDVRKRPWQVADHTATSVTCRLDSRDFPDFNFPWPVTFEIVYSLGEDTFDTRLSLTNVGESPMPAGFGFHPYFNRAFGARGEDEAHLHVHVEGVYPSMPAGPMQPVPPIQSFARSTAIGDRDIDHCFGGWDGRATISWPSTGVSLMFECDPIFNHLVIYTPPGKPFFAVEPVTIANNGFNLHAEGQPNTGVQTLAPGETLSGTFRIWVGGF